MEDVPSCVVTGGRGFTARYLVLQLIRSGKWVVRIMDLASQIVLHEDEKSGLLGEALASGRAHYVCADLRVKSQVSEACKGAITVFHMAAPDSSVNNLKLHFSVSVSGTRNVVEACIEQNVKKLIYTSSPSVVFDGIHGIYNGDESLPYPEKHNDAYSETKAQAEALVLTANGKSGLVTCAIRPSSIFGPGDRLLVPSLVAAARSGKMKFILGDGKNLYDFTYVENVAHAHICAEQALIPGKCYGEEVAAGKPYFITNMEARRFWDFVSEILEGLGYDRPKLHLPIMVIMPLAHLVEWAYKLVLFFGVSRPQLTPSRVRLVTSWRTFNCDRAVKLLGYKPIVSLKDGIRLTIDSFSHLRAEPRQSKSRDSIAPSKAHKMLGGGRVADVVLWRNERTTFAFVSAVFSLLYFPFAFGQTFISSAAKCLLLIVVALFFQSLLPPLIYCFKIPKVSPTSPEIPDKTVYMLASLLRCLWNITWNNVKAVAKPPPSWLSFFKVVLFLELLKFIAGFSFLSVVGTAMVVTLSLFYVYDQKEEEIDEVAKSIMDVYMEFKVVVVTWAQGILVRAT